MKRTMVEVSVTSDNDGIKITQPNMFSNENGEDSIFLDAAQIDILIEWLKEAKAEALKRIAL